MKLNKFLVYNFLIIGLVITMIITMRCLIVLGQLINIFILKLFNIIVLRLFWPK